MTKVKSLSPSLLPILSKEEILERAPQVYTKEPLTSKVSKKYTFIPTYQIVEDMKKLGWDVCQAVTMKSKNKNQLAYGKHMIKFFNPNVKVETDGGVEAFPQIVIMNNHRGWGRFRFEIGLFRLVCSNGLVVKDKDFGSFVMRHLGYTFDDLNKLVNAAVETLPGVIAKINTMEQTVMTPVQMKSFAIKALKLRMEGKDVSPSDNEINEILRANRKEDEGNSLWRVFNRVQEKLIKGGFSLTNQAKKERKVRSINNMLKDLDLNQKLWTLSETVMVKA